MSASMAAVGGDGPPDEQRGHVVTVSLSADELRLVFAQLLTTRDCEKDFGRCASAALRLCGFAACGYAPKTPRTGETRLGKSADRAPLRCFLQLLVRVQGVGRRT